MKKSPEFFSGGNSLSIFVNKYIIDTENQFRIFCMYIVYIVYFVQTKIEVREIWLLEPKICCMDVWLCI